MGLRASLPQLAVKNLCKINGQFLKTALSAINARPGRFAILRGVGPWCFRCAREAASKSRGRCRAAPPEILTLAGNASPCDPLLAYFDKYPTGLRAASTFDHPYPTTHVYPVSGEHGDIIRTMQRAFTRAHRE